MQKPDFMLGQFDFEVQAIKSSSSSAKKTVVKELERLRKRSLQYYEIAERQSARDHNYSTALLCANLIELLERVSIEID
jgi:hypothetical protein